MIWALGAVLATVMGVVLGLLGGGGSILALPILTYVLEVEPKAAIATSLLVVGATSLAAVIAHVRAGNVVWKVALTFAPFAMVGAYLGGVVAQWVPATVLLLGFGAMMLIAAVSMWKGKKDGKVKVIGTHWLVLEALVVGFITGMVGAGGGFMVVPVLLFFVGLEMKQAIGTSLFVIAAKSFAGFAGFVAHVEVPWSLAAGFVAFAVLGSFVGTALNKRVEADKLRKGFAVFIVVIALFIFARELNFSALSVVPAVAWITLAVGIVVNVWGLKLIREARN